MGMVIMGNGSNLDYHSQNIKYNTKHVFLSILYFI